MTQDKIKPCPFCGSKDIESSPGYEGFTYYLDCNECFATGPEVETEAEAVALWNKRPGQIRPILMGGYWDENSDQDKKDEED